MKIIVATGNKGKLKEIKEIFSEYEIISNKEAGFNIDIEEDAKTFEENALKKAKSIAKVSGEICLGDDSGIMIDYFNGWPGVRTARWMDGTDKEKNLAIIEKMQGIPKEQRTIHWVTAIAIVDKEGNSHTGIHSVDGTVALEPRGENGFGFDEIFELPNGKTLAELSDEEKNNLIVERKRKSEILYSSFFWLGTVLFRKKNRPQSEKMYIYLNFGKN